MTSTLQANYNSIGMCAWCQAVPNNFVQAWRLVGVRKCGSAAGLPF